MKLKWLADGKKIVACVSSFLTLILLMFRLGAWEVCSNNIFNQHNITYQRIASRSSQNTNDFHPYTLNISRLERLDELVLQSNKGGCHGKNGEVSL